MNRTYRRDQLERRARNFLLRSSRIGANPGIDPRALDRLVDQVVIRTIRQLKGTGATVIG